MLIELSGVSKRYGKIAALAGLDAEIDGQVIGLLGPNGAGKSTLLKALLGLTTFDGKARVLQFDPRTESFKIRDRVGYMPEMDSYLAGMTAVELCSYAAELSGLPKSEAMQRAHAALYYAGLEEKRYLKVEGYSTGLKQRVKLAQALVHDPELLFLDEPTNGLDPRARDEMLALIEDLPTRRGCSVVLSTHLLPDVDRICDRVVILHRGELRFSGTVAELRSGGDAQSAHAYDVEVKEGASVLVEALRSAQCTAEDVSERQLEVTLPAGASSALVFRKASEAQVQVRHLALKRETLETAFLRVVGVEL